MEKIVNELKSKQISVDTYEIKPQQDYGKPLHINPRLIYDTLVQKYTKITIKPSIPNVDKYDLLILASPIWFGTIASPMRAFIKDFSSPGKPVVCIVTSQMLLGYSKKFKDIAKKEGRFNVEYALDVVRGEIDKETLNTLLKIISKYCSKETSN